MVTKAYTDLCAWENLLLAWRRAARGKRSTESVARFVVYPTHRRVKARKVRDADRRLRARLAAYHAGDVSFAELDASIQGWTNHVRQGDSWGLRRHLFSALRLYPVAHRQAKTADKCCRRRSNATLRPPPPIANT